MSTPTGRGQANPSFVATIFLGFALIACGAPSDPADDAVGAGGLPAGGAFSTGGAFATGGAPATGGAFATGGEAVGGAFASGGAGVGVGGSGGTLSSSGGAVGSGGAPLGTGGALGQYNPCPAPPDPCKLMPSGDSITVGAQSTETGGYRVPLFHTALQSSKTITFVGPSGAGPATVDGITFPENHDGHSGYIIDTIGTRKGLLPLVEQNLTKFAPHVMLLMIGTNDINSKVEVATAPTRLATVVDTVIENAPDTLLVVAQLIPTRTDSLNQDVKTYNAAMADLVAERQGAGKHLILVDMYGAFIKNPSYKDELLFDGLHPNDAGYAVMVDVWYDAVEQYLH